MKGQRDAAASQERQTDDAKPERSFQLRPRGAKEETSDTAALIGGICSCR
uniref:Uncharacterized protein n=1 Tax=Anguilla anguilla TaxID=7936 RepID=A0A0E9RYX6_ANGAN